MLSTYLPLVDGDATLFERLDTDDASLGWESTNTDVLGDNEALLNLSVATFTQLTTLYGSVADDPSPPGLRHATVRIERVMTMDAAGALVQQRSQVLTRDGEGDRLLTVTLPDGDVVFDPPPVLVPSDIEPGDTWRASGTTTTGIDYAIEGALATAPEAEGFDDCVQIELTETLGDSTTTARSVACAGVGVVSRDDLDADGNVLQHVDLVSVGTRRVNDRDVPIAAPLAPSAVPDGALTLGRVGRATPTLSIAPPTFPATFVPSDPPSVVVASERGDLVAFAADAPDVVRWRFHPGGSMYGAPGFDAETGRLYVGATDKRMYALDARGFFLWSVEVDDNVATRPVITRGVLSFASEGGTAFGFEAATGAARWTTRLDAAAVASPVVVDDTVVFGTDGGTVRAVDIDDGSSRWTRNAKGSVEGAITADAGTVYVADAGGGVSAFAADDGSVSWQVTHDDGFRTGPTVIGGLVVVVGESGVVYAHAVADGRLVWTHSGGFVGPVAETSGHIAITRFDGVVDELSLEGDLVQQFAASSAVAPTDPAPRFTLGVTSGDGAVWTVDESTVVRRLGPGAAGLTALQARWVHTFSEPQFNGSGFMTTVGEFDGQAVVVDVGGAVYLGDPATGDLERLGDDPDSPVPASGEAVVDGDQLFMNVGPELHAVDLRTGEVQWSDGGQTFVPNGPIVVGDAVISLRSITNEDGSVDADVAAFDRATGAVRWKRTMSPAGNGPTLAGGVVIVGSPLTALDPASGEIVWQSDDRERDVVGRPGYDEDGDAVIAAVRLVQDNSATVDLVSVDARTGEEQWRVPLPGRPEFTEEITVAGDVALVPVLGGPLLAFDTATGEQRWEFAPPAPAKRIGNVTVVDGVVWTFSSVAQVFALDVEAGTTLGQSSGLGADISGVFAPFGQRLTDVGGVMVAPLGPFLAAFDPPAVSR